ncbi:MAG: molybdenum cofactor biosynthesis protein MoaE [Solirubrobacterales bacterium]|nr:molybdenum cofactor biosynthesis protein MoaE [Solirubrobacterales bacterium]
MKVSVRLFAQLRERAGARELELELPDGAVVADALAAVEELAAGLPVVLAVNREYAPRDAELHAGDEIALIPPVSGGAPPWVRITGEPLDPGALAERVSDARAGAVVTFTGVTREVDHLDYEAYEDMALERMRTIVDAAVQRHGLCAAAAEHRVGRVDLSEPSVAVAVSAPHRGEAFAGAREIIDELKATAPIWKREEGEWVAGAEPA